MLNSLNSLRGLPLVELFLEGNPLKKRVRDQAHYVRYFAISTPAPSEGVT